MHDLVARSCTLSLLPNRHQQSWEMDCSVMAVHDNQQSVTHRAPDNTIESSWWRQAQQSKRTDQPRESFVLDHSDISAQQASRGKRTHTSTDKQGNDSVINMRTTHLRGHVSHWSLNMSQTRCSEVSHSANVCSSCKIRM